VEHLDWLGPDLWPAWIARVRAECVAKNLTWARKDALVELLVCISSGDGQVKDADVAERAGCSRRTVIRARQDAREAGLLDWEQTRRRVAGRWRQGPNSYALKLPEHPVCPGNPPKAQSDKLAPQGKKDSVGRQGRGSGMARLDCRRQIAALGVSPAELAAAAAASHARAVRLGLARA
jgi:hypothetical protein